MKSIYLELRKIIEKESNRKDEKVSNLKLIKKENLEQKKHLMSDKSFVLKELIKKVKS